MSSNLIYKKQPSWRKNVVDEMCSDWVSVACRLNIPPSEVKTKLPAGSTDYDCARKMMDMLSDRATTVGQLCEALRGSGNERVARMIEKEDAPAESIGEFYVRIYNKLTVHDKISVLQSCGLPGGTVDRIARNGGSADFFGAISNQNYISEASLNISIWSTLPAIAEEMLEFARKYNLEVRGQLAKSEKESVPTYLERVRNETQNDQMAEDDPLAAALANKSKATKALTIGEFVKSPAVAHWRTKICLATDENCNFVRLLTEMGLISQPGMSKFVGDLKAKWNADRTGEPTLTVLKSLARNEQYTDKPVESLFKVFDNLKVKEITAAIAEYRRHRDGKAKSSADRNHAAFESEDDMRQFLLSTSFSAEDAIDDDMETMSEAGVDSVQDLFEFEESDFKDAFGKKFKAARLRKFINLIKRTKSASATSSTTTAQTSTTQTTQETTTEDTLF